MEYNIERYQHWLVNNVTLSNAYSNEALRTITIHMLMGKNYRLLTEKNTKEKLLLTYLWIMDVVSNAKQEFGSDWPTQLLQDIQKVQKKTPEQKNLMLWLLGITAKTATNLGIAAKNFPEVLSEVSSYIDSLFQRIERTESKEMAWLLLIGGAATLNIRGSDKSKVGKQLEKVLIKSILIILGFTEGENFWVNIGRDEEIEREADAEVLTRRGRIRIEVGLIAAGNQEVIEDKIGRLGRNGIVLFDVVGPKSRIHETAKNAGVNLVQLRNSEPIVHIHRILQPLVEFELNQPPRNEQDITRSIDNIPDNVFSIPNIALIDETED